MKKLLLGSIAAALLSTAAHAHTITCGPPQVTPYDNDRNPVVAVDVSYEPQFRAWQIFHHRANGAIVSRNAQYVIADRSDSHVMRWGGELAGRPWLYMVGKVWINFQTGEARYEEALYDRNRGDHLDMRMVAACALNGFAPPPVAVMPMPVPVPPVTIPVPVPVPVPVTPTWTAPAPTGPVQQNAPNNVIVTPAPAPPPNIVISPTIVIPGTTWSPQPKAEAEPKSGS